MSETKRTLYVSRRLKNVAEFTAWALDQGFESVIEPQHLHVTLAFSRTLVDWSSIARIPGELTCKKGPRSVVPLGDRGAVVLRFESGILEYRWGEMCDAGAQWDFPSYKPHITITYDKGSLDLSKVKPFDLPLVFSKEIFREVEDDWEKKIAEVAA